MKSKTRFQKVRLEELQEILPEIVLDGHNRRQSDGSLPAKPAKKKAAKTATRKTKR